MRTWLFPCLNDSTRRSEAAGGVSPPTGAAGSAQAQSFSRGELAVDAEVTL